MEPKHSFRPLKDPSSNHLKGVCTSICKTLQMDRSIHSGRFEFQQSLSCSCWLYNQASLCWWQAKALTVDMNELILFSIIDWAISGIDINNVGHGGLHREVDAKAEGIYGKGNGIQPVLGTSSLMNSIRHQLNGSTEWELVISHSAFLPC